MLNNYHSKFYIHLPQKEWKQFYHHIITQKTINIDYGTIRMMKNMDGNIERQKMY